MENAVLLIQNEKTLTKVADGIEGLEMNNRNTMGDTYDISLVR